MRLFRRTAPITLVDAMGRLAGLMKDATPPRPIAGYERPDERFLPMNRKPTTVEEWKRRNQRRTA